VSLLNKIVSQPVYLWWDVIFGCLFFLSLSHSLSSFTNLQLQTLWMPFRIKLTWSNTAKTFLQQRETPCDRDEELKQNEEPTSKGKKRRQTWSHPSRHQRFLEKTWTPFLLISWIERLKEDVTWMLHSLIYNSIDIEEEWERNVLLLQTSIGEKNMSFHYYQKKERETGYKNNEERLFYSSSKSSVSPKLKGCKSRVYDSCISTKVRDKERRTQRDRLCCNDWVSKRVSKDMIMKSGKKTRTRNLE
jgi:hypothetical protein